VLEFDASFGRCEVPRFAHVKRNLSGRAAIVAVLEDWQVICSAVVAAGSMIMLGMRLYRDWPQ
jgi:hypothetical protein